MAFRNLLSCTYSTSCHVVLTQLSLFGPRSVLFGASYSFSLVADGAERKPIKCTALITF